MVQRMEKFTITSEHIKELQNIETDSYWNTTIVAHIGKVEDMDTVLEIGVSTLSFSAGEYIKKDGKWETLPKEYKKQYTITEWNDNEAEHYGYILNLSISEYEAISAHIKTTYDEYIMSIKQTDYIQAMIDLVNTHSSNNYMKRLQWAKLSTSIDVNDLSEEHFYKGYGLLFK